MERTGGEGEEVYPGVVEFGLDADHLAFFLILCAKDIKLGGVERPNRSGFG
jgi:hypothetical protein